MSMLYALVDLWTCCGTESMVMRATAFRLPSQLSAKPERNVILAKVTINSWSAPVLLARSRTNVLYRPRMSIALEGISAPEVVTGAGWSPA